MKRYFNTLVDAYEFCDRVADRYETKVIKEGDVYIVIMES